MRRSRFLFITVALILAANASWKRSDTKENALDTMALASLNIQFDSTLGAAFLGNITASIFYGITSLQTFIYFRRNQEDRLYLKYAIFFLWVLDTLQLIFVTHAMYNYLITDFSNPLAIAFPTWSILAQVFVSCVSDLIVRSIFGWRVYSLSNRNVFLTFAIGATSIYVFGGGFAYAAEGFIVGTFNKFSEISWLLYSGFGLGVLSDSIIAVSLCVILARSRTGFEGTDSIVSTLMIYTINTGLLTSVCSAIGVICYAVWPNDFYFIAIYFALSKVYVNALLANLNARLLIRKQGHIGKRPMYNDEESMPNSS